MAHRRGLARSILLALLGLALVLGTSTPASAHGGGAGPRVMPYGQGGELLGVHAARTLARPTSETSPACESFQHGKVVSPRDNGATCRVKAGTKIFVLPFWNECSNVEPPFSDDAAVQAQCAADFPRAVTKSVLVTVDDGPTVDIHAPRFAAFSPQGHVRLPEDNIFGIEPQRISFVAFGWVGVVRGLAPGTHTLHVDLVLDFGDGPSTDSFDATIVVSHGHC